MNNHGSLCLAIRRNGNAISYSDNDGNVPVKMVAFVGDGQIALATTETHLVAYRVTVENDKPIILPVAPYGLEGLKIPAKSAHGVVTFHEMVTALDNYNAEAIRTSHPHIYNVRDLNDHMAWVKLPSGSTLYDLANYIHPIDSFNGAHTTKKILDLTMAVHYSPQDLVEPSWERRMIALKALEDIVRDLRGMMGQDLDAPLAKKN